MKDLIEFYRARLDEDESAAQALMRGGNPKIGKPGQWNAYLEGGDEGWAVEDDAAGMAPGIVRAREVADHVAQHDPARVLRKVEAGRELIKLCETRWTHDLRGTEGGLEMALELAVYEWADHPDYQENWRP